MKKSFYFALALTAGLFASCSSDELTADAPQASITVDDSQPVPIVVGVSNGSGVSASMTRGSGTVGTSEKYTDNTDPTNVITSGSAFLGQEFQLFMFEKGSFIPASADGTNAVYCDSTFRSASLAEIFPTTGTPATPGSTKMYVNNAEFQAYYPTQGNFDFWAYRIDDATRATTGVNGVTGFAAVGADATADAATEVKVGFTIDGTQDIMLGAPSATQLAADAATLKTKVTSLSDAEAAEKIYSAYSARRGINPTLNFQHMLTRLHFAVKADSKKVSIEDRTYGALGDANGIPTKANGGFYGFRVDSIAVYSKKTGNLIVAYKPTSGYANTSKIEFTDGDWADKGSLTPMYLKERSGKVTQKQDGTFQQVAKFAIAADGTISYSGNITVNNSELDPTDRGNRLTQPQDLVYGSDAVNSVTGVPSDCIGTIKKQADAKWAEIVATYDTDDDKALDATELGTAAQANAIPFESAAFYTYYKTQLLQQDATPDVTVPLKDLTGQTLEWKAPDALYWALATKAEYSTATDKATFKVSVPDFSTGISEIEDATNGVAVVAADVDATTLAHKKAVLLYFDLDGSNGFSNGDMVLGYLKAAKATVTTPPTGFDGVGVARPIGEALLVAPATAADGYNIDIKFSRYRREGTKMVWKSEVKPVTIKQNIDFESGKSHLVTITLYQDSTPEAEVVDDGWTEGGGFPVGD